MPRPVGSRSRGAGFELHKARVQRSREQIRQIQQRENDNNNTVQRQNVEQMVRDRLNQAYQGQPPEQIEQVVRVTLDEIGQLDDDADTFNEQEFDAVFEELEFHETNENHLLERDPELRHNPETEQMQADLNAWVTDPANAEAVAQAGLNPEGILVDGLFGPETELAVTTFQQANGLAANGIVDTNFYSALYPEAAAQATPDGSQAPLTDESIAALDAATAEDNHPSAGDLLDESGAFDQEAFAALDQDIQNMYAQLDALPPEHPDRARLEGQVQGFVGAAEAAAASAEQVSGQYQQALMLVSAQDADSLNGMSEGELLGHFNEVAGAIGGLEEHLTDAQLEGLYGRLSENLGNLNDEEISSNDREVAAAFMDSELDLARLSGVSQGNMVRTLASAHDGDTHDDQRGPAERLREAFDAVATSGAGAGVLSVIAGSIEGDSQNRFIDYLSAEQLAQLDAPTLDGLQEGHDGKNGKAAKLQEAIALQLAAPAEEPMPVPTGGPTPYA